MLLHQKKNHYLRVGLVMTALITLLAVVGAFWTPYEPTAIAGGAKFAAPSLGHLFGTDNFGRDIFSRVMCGVGTTFFIALGTILLGAGVGILIGAFTGYFGGVVDETSTTRSPPSRASCSHWCSSRCSASESIT